MKPQFCLSINRKILNCGANIPVPPYGQLAKIPVKESKEPLIDLLLLSDRMLSGMTKQRMKLQDLKEPLLLARKSVGDKLLGVLDNLDNSFGLMIFDAHRPLLVQRIWFWEEIKKLQKIHPTANKEKCIEIVKRWVSPGNLNPASPHSTGGAIDLTLVTFANGVAKPLDMGTNYLDWSPKSWTFSKEIPKKARQNRLFLLSILKKVNMQNFEGEWWHFGFGDQDWAFRSKSHNAIFGPVDVNFENGSITFLNTKDERDI